jgi:hypothetical protein
VKNVGAAKRLFLGKRGFWTALELEFDGGKISQIRLLLYD